MKEIKKLEDIFRDSIKKLDVKLKELELATAQCVKEKEMYTEMLERAVLREESKPVRNLLDFIKETHES